MMKNILMILVLLVLVIVGYKLFQPERAPSSSITDLSNTPPVGAALTTADFDEIQPTYVDLDPNSAAVPVINSTTNSQPTTSRFSCDGRQHCSQMTSCEEATYFTQHCPNTKMDGNHDGVPCEQQLCN